MPAASSVTSPPPGAPASAPAQVPLQVLPLPPPPAAARVASAAPSPRTASPPARPSSVMTPPASRSPAAAPPGAAAAAALAGAPETSQARVGASEIEHEPDYGAVLRKLRAHRYSTDRHCAHLKELHLEARSFSSSVHRVHQELQEAR